MMLKVVMVMVMMMMLKVVMVMMIILKVVMVMMMGQTSDAQDATSDKVDRDHGKLREVSSFAAQRQMWT